MEVCQNCVDESTQQFQDTTLRGIDIPGGEGSMWEEEHPIRHTHLSPTDEVIQEPDGHVRGGGGRQGGATGVGVVRREGLHQGVLEPATQVTDGVD